MKLRNTKFLLLLCLAGLFWAPNAGGGNVPAQSESARALIARVLANRLAGFRGRGRLVQTDPHTRKDALQRFEIKARRDGKVVTVLYQLISPAASAGRAVLLLMEDGHPAKGSLIEAPQSVVPLDAQGLQKSLFGTDLRIEDLTDSFYYWPDQRIAGGESIQGCQCTIIESHPGSEVPAPYALVRSWICPRMALPLRVEKVGRDPNSTRTLTVERAAKADRDHWGVRSLVVTTAAGTGRTLLEVSSFQADVQVPEVEFTVQAIVAAFQSGRNSQAPGKKWPEAR